MDLLITILGIISGCTFGSWDDSMNLYGSYVEVEKGGYKRINCMWDRALLHSLKYTNRINFLREITINRIKGIINP